MFPRSHLRWKLSSRSWRLCGARLRLWRSAVAALSPHLGEEAARARVEASLRAEKLAQDSLSQVRLKHFKLTLRICRLEAELREEEEEEFNREVLEVKNQQLEAERRQKELTERKAAEIKQLINENIRVSQVLPEVKEKLCQIQVEVKNKLSAGRGGGRGDGQEGPPDPDQTGRRSPENRLSSQLPPDQLHHQPKQSRTLHRNWDLIKPFSTH
ncbi:uncharacterized protein LOC111949232 [Oryzias latipes]|uniref:uncharacterized protein LOC111949232 n=1 Tax=Oryzias latipes TaxID=8090 RepID=UPI000CE27BED|nr:uncharacterized protein LOC111949232 [Oryzias latipes]